MPLDIIISVTWVSGVCVAGNFTICFHNIAPNLNKTTQTNRQTDGQTATQTDTPIDNNNDSLLNLFHVRNDPI